MFEQSRNASDDKKRAALLSLVMLVVLVASVAVAWLLVEQSRTLSRRGSETIQKIQSSGLSSYWKPAQLYYLAYSKDGGKPIGWQRILRYGNVEGFSGQRNQRMYTQRGDINQQEQWQLSNDGHNGRYNGIVRVKGEVMQTLIEQRGEQLLVSSVGGEGGGSAKANLKEHPNYVPEGMFDLAVFLAAQGGKEMTFQMIFNEQAVAQKQVIFGVVKVKPINNRQVDVEMGSGEVSYVFNAQGEIQEIKMSDAGTFRLASPADVMKYFPDAMGDQVERTF